MANTIKIKNSGTASSAPSAASLQYGELAINYADGKLYFKKSGTVVDYFTAGAGSGATAIDDLTDVTITSAASGDFLKYNGTAWVNDPINLGTDTIGDYMSNVSAGTGISITHTPSEGSTATVAVDTAYAGFTPIGGVIMWSGNTANIPAGWLLCDGNTYSTSSYVSLSNVIGTRYGSGGAGTFKVPDFTGRVPEGITGVPTVPDTITTSASSAVDAHTHTVNSSFTAGNATSHTHSFSANTGNESHYHYHYWSAAGVGTTDPGNHTHSYFKPNSGGNNNTGGAGGHTHTWSLFGQRTGVQSIPNSETDQLHYHALSGTTGNPSATSINSSFTAGTATTVNASTLAHTHTTASTNILFIIRAT